jgi:hypothetical protein
MKAVIILLVIVWIVWVFCIHFIKDEDHNL